jgi:hypothetical protein
MVAAVNSKKWFLIACLTIGWTCAHAHSVQVNCDGDSQFSSISAALRYLSSLGTDTPNTISVKGSCHENPVIRDLGRLTIAGSAGASISDASNGTRDVIVVDNTRLTVSGMTINGNVNTDGIDCYHGAYCFLVNNTFQGAYDGVGIYKTATGVVVGGVLQNNFATGIQVSGEATMTGVTIRANPIGVNVTRGGRALIGVGDPVFDPVPTDTPVLIINNGIGAFVGEGAELRCAGCTIRNNSGDGMHVDLSAAISVTSAFAYDGTIFQSTITNNAGSGVYIGDLSSAAFSGQPSVSGNGRLDIDCNSATAVTRAAIAAAGGAVHTNCSN